MPSRIVLLRGINLGPRNRIAMPALRERLTAAGFVGVRTYVASGNIVLSSEREPAALAQQVEELIADAFALKIDAIARTRDELAEVVRRNPLREVAVNPKRYQVSFLDRELDSETLGRVSALATEPERLVAIGRELYAWHPEGVARSKLWAQLAGKGLGAKATARNWSTVTTLLAMAEEAEG
jgi:uncharacterized protein (DUF1697 family)